jgi:triacylglycerol lipase
VGAVLVSGVFRVTKEDAAAPNVAAYFGKDELQYAERSPITHVAQSKVPLFLATAEWDPPFLFSPTLELAAEVCRRDGKCPRMIWLKGHNHISEMASFDTADHELGDAILDWMGGLK